MVGIFQCLSKLGIGVKFDFAGILVEVGFELVSDRSREVGG